MIVETPRLSLHVQPMGSQGSPIVMLHGAFVGNLMTWWLTAAPELAHQHRVFPYDLRGHGRSERKPDGYDVESHVADLMGLLDALGLEEPVTLVGHSFGAVIALAAALSHPHRVARLALVDPPLPPTDPGAVERFLAQPFEALQGALPGGLREVASAVAGSAGGGRRGRRLADGLLFLATETGLPAVLTAGWDAPDDALRALSIPTLVIGGARSPCAPAVERLGATLPRVEVLVLDVGHFVPMEAPEAVTRALVRFCAEPEEVLHG